MVMVKTAISWAYTQGVMPNRYLSPTCAAQALLLLAGNNHRERNPFVLSKSCAVAARHLAFSVKQVWDLQHASQLEI